MSHYQKQVDAIRKKIMNLGPFIPGTLSKQWNTCGTAGCKCHRQKSKRHGPYYQLSFTVNGRSSTFFVKKEHVREVHKRMRRFKRFKQLCNELKQAYIECARHEGFNEVNDHDE